MSLFDICVKCYEIKTTLKVWVCLIFALNDMIMLLASSQKVVYALECYFYDKFAYCFYIEKMRLCLRDYVYLFCQKNYVKTMLKIMSEKLC